MAKIIIFQNGLQTCALINQFLTEKKGLMEGIQHDFVILSNPLLVEPLIQEGKPQILITSKIITPQRTQQILKLLRAKNDKLFLVSLSTIDLGPGFDRRIVKGAPGMLEEISRTIEDFDRENR